MKCLVLFDGEWKTRTLHPQWRKLVPLVLASTGLREYRPDSSARRPDDEENETVLPTIFRWTAGLDRFPAALCLWRRANPIGHEASHRALARTARMDDFKIKGNAIAS